MNKRHRYRQQNYSVWHYWILSAMQKTLKNYWLITFTLFALIGQGLLANGSSMVPMDHQQSHMVTQALGDGSGNTVPMNSMQQAFAMTDCHGNLSEPQSQQADNSNSCCNGLGGCSIDCNHCLTISFTADLSDIQLDIANAPANPAPLTATLNSFSVDFPPAFRPPIA